MLIQKAQNFQKHHSRNSTPGATGVEARFPKAQAEEEGTMLGVQEALYPATTRRID